MEALKGIDRENVSVEVLRDPQLLAGCGYSNTDFPRPTRRSKNVGWRKAPSTGGVSLRERAV